MIARTFITATQEWVKNRIQEAKDYATGLKDGIVELITDLATKETKDMESVQKQFASMADEIVTGKLTVEGDTAVTGNLNVDGPVVAHGIGSSAPIVCNNPEGIIINSPKGIQTGLNSFSLTLTNEKGKIARLFVCGDKLVYDYEYDKIYTCFNKTYGSTLRYLRRGSTPLKSIITQIEELPDDTTRIMKLEEWFSQPDCMREPARLFGQDVNECFPATGASFLIPESMIFQVPETYKINSIRLLDATGNTTKILKDFTGRNIKKLLINFPFVHSANETIGQNGYAGPSEVAPEEISQVQYVTEFPVDIPHVADFENGYYEVTDPDVSGDWKESLDEGLIPNVLLKLNEFPKDEISVIYFDVKEA